MKSESVKWVVWCDPVENAKSVLQKFLVLTDARQEFVAECRTPEEAGLIAAAPELLSALEGMMEWARRVKGPNPGPEIRNAHEAITKAHHGSEVCK